MRQVETIGSLVSEFSSFARMPTPVFKRENFTDICRQAIDLQQSAHPDITYEFKASEKPIFLECDAHQITQVLTNLLKNASESIDEKKITLQDNQKEEKETLFSPEKIVLQLSHETQYMCLEIFDTGLGLPKAGRERLTEPYYTTRAQGTGLGLAIVQKIMQDHHGTLELMDRHDVSGAHVKLFFPIKV